MKPSKARSCVYRIFGNYIAFPTVENWQASLEQQKWLLFENTADDLPYPWDFGELAIKQKHGLDDLNTLFTANFDTGTASVSLHSRSYSNKGDQKILEELFRFYEHFGLDLSANNNDFWPDALQVELEFMHYLSYLEGMAEDGALSIVKAQRDFLIRHLEPLVSGINDLVGIKNIPVYTHLMSALYDFLEAECRYLNETIGDQIILKQVC